MDGVKFCYEKIGVTNFLYRRAKPFLYAKFFHEESYGPVCPAAV